MFSIPRSNLRPANVQTISIKSWEQGVVTANDVPRTPEGALSSAANVIIDQDGVIRPRPSLMLYGTQPSGTVLGEIYEFKDTTVSPYLNYRICLQAVGGSAQVYYSKDLGSWVQASGKSYDINSKAHFLQVDNKVLVMTGDNLSYFDIPTKTIIPFLALTTPNAPLLSANTGLTGTTFTITYRIAANSTVGTTIASTALSVQVSTDRDLWNASSQSIAITWDAVAGAKSYSVYMGVGGVGTEFLIATGINGTSYTDNGTAYQDTTHQYPLVDSTAGPKAVRGSLINGQVFLIQNGYNVVVGGTYPNTLDFSPANGGNTVPVGVGSKDIPVQVKLTTGNGGSQIKVYCSGTNGKGRRFTLKPDSLTVGNQTVNFFDVLEDDGESGTDSPDAMLYYNNQLYYPSADGFKTDGILPQLQTFISTRKVSNTIQPDIATLNREAMANAVGMEYQGRLLFALPANAMNNNAIWPLDLEHGGGWMKQWNIAADWMMQYNSNTVANGGDGKTHYTVLQNNQVYELTYQVTTSDNGVDFPTSITSGQNFFSKDQRVCAKLLNVIFTFNRPAGQINVSVNGQFRNNAISASGDGNYEPNTSIVGWSENAWSDAAWSEVRAVAVKQNVSSKDIKVKVNKEVRWFSYGVDTPNGSTDYALSNVVAEFVVTGIRDL